MRLPKNVWRSAPPTAQWMVTALAATVLLSAVAFYVGGRKYKDPSLTTSLTTMFPSADSLLDWTVEQRPVAETAEIKKAHGELLNYSEAVYTIYAKGGVEVQIYAAYWPPARMAHRLVAGHTPDVCWVGSGWVCEKSGVWRNGRAGVSAMHQLEHRIFARSGTVVHVAFAHFIPGRVIDYSTKAAPPWYALFSDMFDHGLYLREEQFFMRISSNQPIEEVMKLVPTRQFMEKVENLMLRMNGQTGSRSCLQTSK